MKSKLPFITFKTMVRPLAGCTFFSMQRIKSLNARMQQQYDPCTRQPMTVQCPLMCKTGARGVSSVVAWLKAVDTMLNLWSRGPCVGPTGPKMCEMDRNLGCAAWCTNPCSKTLLSNSVRELVLLDC